ncbi:preprotein translocase subunit SecE [Paracoccus limosus]|jgi:preprotein translocase subunit SecE|uniref:Protein translocase subunit SecE n=2 Tax=Paracoccus limosus TaxID=913252 RepID=A0A844H5A2_9RHOB|nr:preprotein translocase subunit SecE [Paracoccus limosus]MTH34754.1 preprotein translocase subunit SecE [Paracoccus limosus]
MPARTGYLTRCKTEGINMANPVQFISQVRAEVGKISWPTRREVITTTVMVFVMATLASIFFFLVDLAIKSGLSGILHLVG